VIGHNKRTCPEIYPLAAQNREKRLAMRGTRVCRICGLPGHNARTCESR
jgi:hypothetical protein